MDIEFLKEVFVRPSAIRSSTLISVETVDDEINFRCSSAAIEGILDADNRVVANHGLRNKNNDMETSGNEKNGVIWI